MGWPLSASETVTAVISSLSAFVAVFAASATVWFARRNLSRQIVDQQVNLAMAKIKYFEDFRKWADELADVLTEAIHLCDLDPQKVVGESFFLSPTPATNHALSND